MINLASSQWEIFSAVLVCAGATFATRALPFYMSSFSFLSSLEVVEKYIGQMIMVVLVFYSLKGINLFAYPYAIPEISGVAVAILVHLISKNALFSIILSTAVYMCLLRFL
ncbi:branched-chain amino acid transporter permease [Campylobacter sp. 19-13652]|uniref:branched-chain amino acid transporter permease n=1 Tax=Campylobacter sp. 19-13652 TaxID=2840180 RepID=UPI001C756349|nr:AzlD domain-containing protein [Campylobacter sp. 19-13652]BCX79118.1 hypothetical protein LBC_05800 [Campylobacter sp. 19-13652]